MNPIIFPLFSSINFSPAGLSSTDTESKRLLSFSSAFQARMNFFLRCFKANINYAMQLQLTFQGFALFSFVGLDAGKLIKKMASK